MYYTKDYATKLFDEYMQLHSDPRDLSFRQIDAVISAIQQKNFKHPATIEDVDLIIEEKFPEESEMAFRPGYKAPQQTQPQQAAQSKKEINQIISYFLTEKYFERVAPLAIPP